MFTITNQYDTVLLYNNYELERVCVFTHIINFRLHNLHSRKHTVITLLIQVIYKLICHVKFNIFFNEIILDKARAIVCLLNYMPDIKNQRDIRIHVQLKLFMLYTKTLISVYLIYLVLVNTCIFLKDNSNIINKLIVLLIGNTMHVHVGLLSASSEKWTCTCISILHCYVNRVRNGYERESCIGSCSWLFIISTVSVSTLLIIYWVVLYQYQLLVIMLMYGAFSFVITLSTHTFFQTERQGGGEHLIFVYIKYRRYG